MEEAKRPVGRTDRPAEVIEINPEGLQRHMGTVQRATRWNSRCETLFQMKTTGYSREQQQTTALASNNKSRHSPNRSICLDEGDRRAL